MVSPHYQVGESAADTCAVDTAQGPISTPRSISPPCGKDTFSHLNVNEQLMVTRLIGAVGEALVSAALLGQCSKQSPHPPPAAVLSPSTTPSSTSPSLPSDSPKALSRPTPPRSAAPHPTPRKSSRPRKPSSKAASSEKRRNPLTGQNVNIVSRLDIGRVCSGLTCPSKVKKTTPLRGAEGKIFINREMYQNSTAISLPLVRLTLRHRVR